MNYLLPPLLFLLLSFPVAAQLSITEVYPSPLEGKEWVEIHNTGTTAVSLTDVRVNDASNKALSFIETTIEPGTFILAESSAILNNSGDTVSLFKGDTLLDIATYSATIAADSSYARCTGTQEWHITKQITKKQQNPSCTTPTPSPTISTITPPPISAAPLTPSPMPEILVEHIYISEFMPNPATGENEWVELYNGNNSQVVLDKWFIDDVDNGGSKPKEFTLTIPANGYAVLDLSTGIFNNSTDTIRLLRSDETEANVFEYSRSEKNKSWGRQGTNGSFCIQNPTKGTANGSCATTEAVASGSTKSKTTISTSPPQGNKTTKTTSQPAQQIEEYPWFSTNPSIPDTVSGRIIDLRPQVAPTPVHSHLMRSISFLGMCLSLLVFIRFFIRIKSLSLSTVSNTYSAL